MSYQEPCCFMNRDHKRPNVSLHCDDRGGLWRLADKLILGVQQQGCRAGDWADQWRLVGGGGDAEIRARCGLFAGGCSKTSRSWISGNRWLSPAQVSVQRQANNESR